MSPSTVFRWVRQDRIDCGEIPGTSTEENAELRAARRRIAELEAELAYRRRFSTGSRTSTTGLGDTARSACSLPLHFERLHNQDITAA